MKLNPRRLSIITTAFIHDGAAPVDSAGDALVWPGMTPLKQVLSGKRGSSACGMVTGADASAVLRVLGTRYVYSRWTDAGQVTGLNVGALVPGQDGCGDD